MNLFDEKILFGDINSFYNFIDKSRYSSIFIVSDDNKYVKNITLKLLNSLIVKFGQSFKVDCCFIESNEQAKSINTVEFLWSEFLKFGLNRGSLVLSVGGGVISDMSGFCASTYMRGVSFASIPTTLLSCVDAAIGGKRAINYKDKKNSIGSFWFCDFIFLDLNVLNTLNPSQICSGFCEILKLGFITGGELLERVKKINIENNFSCLVKQYDSLKKLVDLSIKCKKRCVKDDPYDKKSIRAFLNYGHTYGHAIEQALNYKIPHGLAVATGMDIVADDCVKERQREIFKKCGINIDYIYKKLTDRNIHLTDLEKYIRHDKKIKGNGLSLVKLKDFGQPCIEEITIN